MSKPPPRDQRTGKRKTKPRSSERAARWLPAVIALVTFLAFAPAVDNGFTQWDDPLYVTHNYQIRDLSLHGLGANFSTFVYGNYHPLTMASLALDYHFWRLNPKGYHLTNVALHVLNTALVFWLIFLLTGSREVSGITALFFGVHPLHVESVAWVSGRKDLLYVLFYLGACISYLKWLRVRPARSSYFFSAVGLFLLSLLSKGMAVTLPLVLLLIDFYIARRVSLRRLLLEKTPFFVLSLAFGFVSIVAQRSAGAIGHLATFPLYERVLFACYGYLAYLFKALVPADLSAFYPYPEGLAADLPVIFWVAPVLVVLIALVVYRSRSRGRGVIFGALFYSLNVALVLQVIPVGRAIIADRYTYLSYVGVGFLIALGIRYLSRGPLSKRHGLKWATIGFTALFGATLFVAARARCEVWRDNVALWTDVISTYPRAGLAYENRAITYRERGDLQSAMVDLERALSLDPNAAGALCNRGNLFYSMGKRERALLDLDRAVRLDPAMADAWNSRGAVRSSLGKHEQALADFDKAIELKSDFAEAYLNRANSLLALKVYDRALAGYDAYIAWEPKDARGYFCRGLGRSTMGDPAGAVEDFGRALRLKPEDAYAYLFRSKARAALNQYEDALRDALEARRLGYPVEQAYLESLQSATPAP
jgi:tetratricopeptide (TPR) repeat protein